MYSIEPWIPSYLFVVDYRVLGMSGHEKNPANQEEGEKRWIKVKMDEVLPACWKGKKKIWAGSGEMRALSSLPIDTKLIPVVFRSSNEGSPSILFSKMPLCEKQQAVRTFLNVFWGSLCIGESLSFISCGEIFFLIFRTYLFCKRALMKVLCWKIPLPLEMSKSRNELWWEVPLQGANDPKSGPRNSKPLRHL